MPRSPDRRRRMTDRKRILFISSGLEIGGGGERQWSLLIPAVRERGHDVSLLTLVEEGHHFHELRRSGIAASSLRMRHRTDLLRLRRALRYGRREVDVVVTASINAHAVGHILARRARAAHLVTEHLGPGPGAPRAAHREALARVVIPRADGVVVVSSAQVPKLLEMGCRRERITVIRNAVPHVSPTASAEVTRARLGVRSDEFVAVLVASLRPEKSVHHFIQAVQQAHVVEARIRGLVVGSGAEFDRLKELAGDDGVVSLLGQRVDVFDILNAADVACLSSAAEASPMTLLEAMALSKPVVATRVGGVPEIVDEEVTGILTPVGDAGALAESLLRLSSDPALARRLGAAGRERQRRHFAMNRMVDEYTAAFDGVARVPGAAVAEVAEAAGS